MDNIVIKNPVNHDSNKSVNLRVMQYIRYIAPGTNIKYINNDLHLIITNEHKQYIQYQRNSFLKSHFHKYQNFTCEFVSIEIYVFRNN